MSDGGVTSAPMKGRSPALAVALAWALPGLGHLYLGRKGRALLYFAVLIVMFGTGMLLQGTLSLPGSKSYLAQLAMIGDLGNGLAYFVTHWAGWGVGRASAATHEAGNAFHWSSGVMNMLLMLDAWDVATGRKGGTESR